MTVRGTLEFHVIDSPVSVDSASALVASQPVAGTPWGLTTVMLEKVTVLVAPWTF
jgi:hypothetical protein